MSASTKRNSARHHRGWLGPIMLAILAASTGAAWWVSQAYGTTAQRGTDIIRKIRNETLRAYWKPEPVTTAYLITNRKGRSAGWEISTRKGTPYGYAGSTWSRGADALYLEKWQVRADASRSKYEARALLDADYSPITINLAEDQVTVQIGGQRTGILASAQAPSNYIPEGVLAVVVRLAARLDRKLAFKMIFNENAIRGGRVQFISVTMTPQPPASVVMHLGQHTKIYRLDAQGRIVRIEHPGTGIVYRTVSVKELIERFPEIRRLLAGST
ncbi:MAG: hypothetical protein ISS78_07680 [Phycisphaerae bacterium]|nr:hypothetical protein [Phycisphaerae bacterium]